jgi:hypothetical protein
VIFGRIGLQKNHQLVDHACNSPMDRSISKTSRYLQSFELSLSF